MRERLDFITPTLMAVLNLFLSDPIGEYYEREVVRKTKVSKGSANKMLRLLANLGLLTRERKGRMVLYRLDEREAIVRQFKILTNVYALKKLTDRTKEESRRIVLFGSCAQGTDVKDSDIDLFILTSAKDSVRREVSEFNRSNDRKVAPIIVDANELLKLKREDRPLYENVQKGIVLWQRE